MALGNARPSATCQRAVATVDADVLEFVKKENGKTRYTPLTWPEELKAAVLYMHADGVSARAMARFLTTWKGGKYKRCSTTICVWLDENAKGERKE